MEFNYSNIISLAALARSLSLVRKNVGARPVMYRLLILNGFYFGL